MKRLILAFLLFTCCAFSAISQQADNSGYVFSIREAMPLTQEGRVYYDVPVELHNTTKDTLYYLTMSCSWQMFYEVDNQNFKVEGVPCDKNFPKVISVAPGKSNRVLLRVLLTKPENYHPESLRIGLNLIKLNSNRINGPVHELRKLKNVIWSNAVILQKK